MRYITDYELSDIPEEEAPEQACTDFDRQDGKYIALPPDVNVVARERPKPTITTKERITIRKALIKKQDKENEIQDETNAVYIKRLKDAKIAAQKKENEIRESKHIRMRQAIEAKYKKEQNKVIIQRERRTKLNQRQKKLQDQAR